MDFERPPFDPSTIDANSIYEYAMERDWIGGGPDSQVFHPDKGAWMFHKYNRNIGLYQITILQELTQVLSEIAPHYIFNCWPWGRVQLQVVTIEKIIEAKTQIFSIKQFIPGYRPSVSDYPQLTKHLNRFSQDMLNQYNLPWIDITPANTKLEKISAGLFPASQCTITDISCYVDTILDEI